MKGPYKLLFLFTKVYKVLPLALFLSIYSCKKFVDVPAPITGVNAENVYTNDATAAAVITGVYTNISRDNLSASLSIIPGLTADELSLFAINNLDYTACITNSLKPSLGVINFWSRLYNKIFIANAAIEGIGNSTSLTPTVKQQLLGEARFLRAFLYFYLVNYYGDVPLAISTDYKFNTQLSRSSKESVYKQIIEDLRAAKDLLSDNYVEANGTTSLPTTGRVRPNKWVASALLSRVYLYISDFTNAELQATEIINNNSLYELLPLNNIFLKNSRECIWQLQVVGINYGANTEEGRVFVLPATGPSNSFPLFLKEELVNSFEPGDQRRVNWIRSVKANGTTYNYPYKYKIGAGLSTSSEYPMILRLAEQYLIRAEARIQQNKIPEGISDLNILRKRASNTSLPLDSQLTMLESSMPKENALIAVADERKHELFTELGHRWLDLKRTGKADITLSAIKGNNWQTTDQLFPIPQDDMDKNPSLKGKQNPGYN